MIEGSGFYTHRLVIHPQFFFECGTFLYRFFHVYPIILHLKKNSIYVQNMYLLMVRQQIRFMEMAHHCCNNWTMCQNFCCVSSTLRSFRHIATVASANTSHNPVVTNVSSPLQRCLHITSHHLMVLLFYLCYVSLYVFAGRKC